MSRKAERRRHSTESKPHSNGFGGRLSLLQTLQLGLLVVDDVARRWILRLAHRQLVDGGELQFE